jgi:hypothetical protein
MAREVEAASAPKTIVTRATELGMVRAHEPVYLEAAAPLRDVAVVPMNTSTAGVGSADMASTGIGDADTVMKVAAPVPVDEDGGATADDVTGTGGSSISGTIGIEAGVSGEVRLPQPATLALEAAPADAMATTAAKATTLAGAAGSASGEGATVGNSTSGSVEVSVTAGVGASSGGGRGGSATSIAGTRAVSGGTGGG